MSIVAAALLVAASGQALAQLSPSDPGPQPGTMLSNAPEMTFETTEHDFGAVMNTDTPTVKFKFRNTGSAPLTISRMTASCGCTTPKTDKTPAVYEPGESGVIEVSLKADAKLGRTHTSATLETNDPNRRQVQLHLYADVRRLVTFEPPLAQFQQVNKGETPTVEVRVIGRSADFAASHVSFTPADAPFDWKIVDTAPFEFKGETLRATTIRFTVKPDAKVGNQFARAVVRTNEPKMDLAELQVMANIKGHIETVPPVVSLGSLTPNQAFNTQLRVNNRLRKPFNVVKVEVKDSSGKEIQAKFEPVAPLSATPGTTASTPDGSSFLVSFSGTAGDKDGTYNGEVVITTDVPGESELRIPFYGYVRATPSRPRAAVAPAGARPAQTQTQPTPAPAIGPGGPAPVAPAQPQGGK
ncbi:MAG: DUF1573 domain-containing protein [Planctomycetota bacterium]|nr:DUF1573 domain-containing protein [Planctomycetota bacterium]